VSLAVPPRAPPNPRMQPDRPGGGRRSGRARPPVRPGSGSIGWCGRGLESLQLMRKSLASKTKGWASEASSTTDDRIARGSARPAGVRRRCHRRSLPGGGARASHRSNPHDQRKRHRHIQAELIPGDCLPPDIGTPDWRWSSLDTVVARIDSLSGVAEGVGLGEVLIQAVERGSDVSAATLLQVSSPAGAARSGRDSL
jgi:hypothetical protein